jgi:hypothetical protein
MVRRISAEQFADTVSVVTGEWRTKQVGRDAVFVRDWELKSSPLTVALGRPVRDQVFTTRDNHATTFQALELVNGSTLERTLQRGSLRLLGQLPPAPQNLFDSGVVRKGSVSFDIDITGAKQVWLLTQDSGSYDPTRTVAGWASAEFVGPKGVTKLADVATISKFTQDSITADEKPLGNSVTVPLNTRLLFPIQGLGFTRLRGTVAVDDRSRPSDIAGSVRFFIFTAEPDSERLLKVDSPPPVQIEGTVKNVDDAIERLYLTLFARKPTPDELRVARQFFEEGNAQPQLKPAPLQDFLWSMLLHPDLQYIY